MQPYLLGIDIGTGSTKAIAITYDGASLDSSQHYYPVKSPKPGYSEQDTEIIAEAFYSCITDVVKKIGYEPVAISFSSAMHSVIAVDENGNALADMITWADSRAEDIARQLRGSEQGAEIYKTSGTPIHAMTPLCKLMWLRQNQPGLFGRAYKFISIKEFLWYKLFRVFEIDYSIASATGLFDIIALTWNPAALGLAGLNAEKLSKPVNTTHTRNDLVPSIAGMLGLKTKIQFIAGASDGCCANLGSYADGPGIASLTIGTSGAVRITSPRPVYNYQAMVFNYLLNPKTFVCGGAVNNGGIILNWLVKSFLDNKLPGHSDYEKVFEQVSTIPAGSEGLLFLPYLYGERAPLWDTKTCGVYFNIKPCHTQEHFLRAGLEGICFTLNDVLNNLEKSSSTINLLHISGGFISAPVWVQILADVTGKTLKIVQQEDASALGAVFLGLDALQIERPPQSHNTAETTIKPNEASHSTYSNAFVVFKRLYATLQDTMHWVHDLGI